MNTSVKIIFLLLPFVTVFCKFLTGSSSAELPSVVHLCLWWPFTVPSFMSASNQWEVCACILLASNTDRHLHQFFK